jgi:hypothetical protein
MSPVPADAETIAIEKEIARLTDAERLHHELEALRAARPFVVATYDRLKNDGGPLFEEVRRALLLDHLRQRRSEASSLSDLRNAG